MILRSLLISVIPLMMTLSADAGIVYSSQFDTGFTDHWEAVSRDGPGAEVETVEVTLPDDSTRIALRLDDTGAHKDNSYLTLSRYIEDQPLRRLEVNLKIRFRSSGRSSADGLDWRVRLLGSSETVHLRMRQRNERNGFSHLQSLPSDYEQSAIESIRLDEWYAVSLSVDLKGKIYSWKAENLSNSSGQTAEVIDIPFIQGNSSNINRLALTTITRGGAFEICDVKVSTMD